MPKTKEELTRQLAGTTSIQLPTPSTEYSRWYTLLGTTLLLAARIFNGCERHREDDPLAWEMWCRFALRKARDTDQDRPSRFAVRNGRRAAHADRGLCELIQGCRDLERVARTELAALRATYPDDKQFKRGFRAMVKIYGTGE